MQLLELRNITHSCEPEEPKSKLHAPSRAVTLLRFDSSGYLLVYCWLMSGLVPPWLKCEARVRIWLCSSNGSTRQFCKNGLHEQKMKVLFTSKRNLAFVITSLFLCIPLDLSHQDGRYPRTHVTARASQRDKVLRKGVRSPSHTSRPLLLPQTHWVVHHDGHTGI